MQSSTLKYDVVELTRKLVSFETLNPPGNEAGICAFLADIFQRAGFETEIVNFGEQRCNVVARTGGHGKKPPLAFTGHIDTVPLGAGAWTVDPYAGVIKDSRLYGRGTCDMKGGVAAVICAALSLGSRLKDGPGLVFFITGGEETGSQGARHIVANTKVKQEIGALVVAEPTDLVPLSGHKGAFWVKAVCKGRTAHGSMPDKGDSAILKAARAVLKLNEFTYGVPDHKHLGSPSLNVGTIKGGINTNSVADHAEFTIDLRTLPGQCHKSLLDRLSEFLGDDVVLTPFVDLLGVWTERADPWFETLADIVSSITGERHEIATVSYFTDASVLTPYHDNVPTVILGPGSPQNAHITDEYCELSQLEQAVDIYRALILDWYK